METGQLLRDQIKLREEELASVEDELSNELWSIPNETHPDVPEGAEEAATLLRMLCGPKPSSPVRCLIQNLRISTPNTVEGESGPGVVETRVFH